MYVEKIGVPPWKNQPQKCVSEIPRVHSTVEGEKKTDFALSDMGHSYVVVFLKGSPAIFKGSPYFIHTKIEQTDTNILLPTLASVVYIELDKCLSHIRQYGYPEDNRELCEWLVLMADTNSPEAKLLGTLDDEKGAILQELKMMSYNKEDLMSMLSEKYGDFFYNSELQLAKLKAAQEGELIGQHRGERRGERRGQNKAKQMIVKNMLEQNFEPQVIADLVGVDLSFIEDTKNKPESV